jgi:Cys-tRNA(Pro)/Cys-tRNA(Cys) deacylase
MTTKTNAMRLLEARGIEYQAIEYDQSGEFHSAVEVAERIGVPTSAVYKTLVVLREPPKLGKPLLVMVPADREVDLRILAKSLGAKKLRMATQREAEELTGLQVGGISALVLLNRGFEVCIDRDALRLEKIHISAGQRGVQVRLGVEALIGLTRARVVSTNVERTPAPPQVRVNE